MSRPLVGHQIFTNHEHERLLPTYASHEAPLRGDPVTLIMLYEQLLRELPLRKKSASNGYDA